jgi:hypothetical protein
MNYKSISVLLRRATALAFLLICVLSSWGGNCRYYNKSVQITVVPVDAGTVYAQTLSNGSNKDDDNDGYDDGNRENMKSETGSDFTFKYCINAGFDKLFFTSTDITGNPRFALSKVYNRKSTDYTKEEKPSEDDWHEIEGVSMNPTISKFEILIADSADDNGKKGVLNGIYVIAGNNSEAFPGDATRKAKGWHTYPDAYVRLYCGQTITDKTDLPARDENYECVCYDRTFYKGWNSVCLPFGIKTSDFKAKLGKNCKLATFKEYKGTENKIQFETVDEVAAGVPCLVYNDSTETNVSLNVSTVERGYATSPVNGEYLKGTLQNTAPGHKVLKLADENSFAWTSESPSVSAYRAYIELPSGSEAKALTIDIDGETTAISAVEAADTASAKVYTANGVQTKSTVKGLNIVKASDGRVKKVMVK